MKKVLFVLLVSLQTVFAADALKIGFVDSNYVIQKSPQLVALREKMNSEFKERIEELKKLVEKVRGMQEKIQKDAATMTEDEKREMSRQFEELQQQIKLKDSNLKKDQQRRSSEEEQKLLAQIAIRISEVGEENGFDFVVQKNALLYAKDSYNISDLVLTKLRSIGK